jgi:hypothetical protein
LPPVYTYAACSSPCVFFRHADRASSCPTSGRRCRSRSRRHILSSRSFSANTFPSRRDGRSFFAVVVWSFSAYGSSFRRIAAVKVRSFRFPGVSLRPALVPEAFPVFAAMSASASAPISLRRALETVYLGGVLPILSPRSGQLLQPGRLFRYYAPEIPQAGHVVVEGAHVRKAPATSTPGISGRFTGHSLVTGTSGAPLGHHLARRQPPCRSFSLSSHISTGLDI